jgi:hypothetical protein
MRGVRAPLSCRRMAQQPFRDERAAALARVDDLQRELARTRAELDATKRKLARRKPWTDNFMGGMMALATLLVVLMGFAVIFGGCYQLVASPSSPTVFH